MASAEDELMRAYPNCPTCNRVATGAVMERPPKRRFFKDPKTGAGRFHYEPGPEMICKALPCLHTVSSTAFTKIIARLRRLG